MTDSLHVVRRSAIALQWRSALIICVITAAVARTAGASIPQNSTVAIVAATEFTHGSIIKIGDIQRERVRFPRSAQRILITDPAQVIGKRVIGHIEEGEPITRTRVQTHNSPTDLTAMALPISAADVELVAIGDSVDVYARSASLGSESAAMIAQQVEVVKISVDRSRFAQSAATVVVLVNPATAVALAGAMNGDRLSIAVHGFERSAYDAGE